MNPSLLLSSYYNLLLTDTASGRKGTKMERVEATGHPWIIGIRITGIIGIIGIIDEDNYTLQLPRSVVMRITTLCKSSHKSRLMLVYICFFFFFLLL